MSGINNDKLEEGIDKASVKPRKQKQNDSTSLKEDVYVETAKMFKCDIREVIFKGDNELEDHIQDWYCMDYDLKLNCKTGLESVVRTRPVDDVLEDNNIESGAEVSAKQESVKNWEIKEDENSGFNTYNALDCEPCEKVLHEESSLDHHMQE